MVERSPLAELIIGRTGHLGLTFEQLGYRLQYANPAKAAGRVDALCNGFIHSRRSLAALAKLPAALEISEELLVATLAATEVFYDEIDRQRDEERDRLRREEQGRWRRSFRPHAILDTEREVPTSITMCGITGGLARWRVILLDSSLPSETFLEQTLSLLPQERLIPFFGRALGFYINHSPDLSRRYTWSGELVEEMTSAFRTGEIQLSIGSRPTRPSTLTHRAVSAGVAGSDQQPQKAR